MTSSILRTTLFSYTKSRTRASRENTDACISTLLTPCGSFIYFNKLSINRKFLNRYIFLLWITKIYLRIFLLCLNKCAFFSGTSSLLRVISGYYWIVIPWLFRYYMYQQPILLWFPLQSTLFTNPIMHLFHIPQCTIQNRNVHISALNGALGDMEQAHYGVCEIGLLNLSQPQWSKHESLILVIIHLENDL